MQVAQAEAVKGAVEHWRSRKFRTAGSLFWQLNDCWPVSSWSCVDWERRPKALYYHARRFYAPVLPIIDRRDGGFSVHVVNDTRAEFAGRLVCGFGHVTGDQQWVESDDVTVPANSVATPLFREASELDLGRAEHLYFWCRLMEGECEVARNTLPLLPCKHMLLEMPEWEFDVERTGPRTYELTLSNWCFAKAVWLRAEGIDAAFADNYFDALPELPVTVALTTPHDIDADELKRRLRVRSAAEAQH